MKKYVMVTSYTTDDLEWDSEEDYKLVKERYGKEPIYFIYERSWAKHKVHSNLPDLYQESRGYRLVWGKCKPDDAKHV